MWAEEHTVGDPQAHQVAIWIVDPHAGSAQRMVQGLAVGVARSIVPQKRQGWRIRDRATRWEKRRIHSAGGDVFKSKTVREGEGAHACANEACHVANSAEGEGDVTCEGADVSAFGAGDLKLQGAFGSVKKLEAVDSDGARRELDLGAAAGEGVGALALYLERGVGGWGLEDFARETNEGGIDGGKGQGRNRRYTRDRAFSVVRFCGAAQRDRCHVCLLA